MHKLKVIQSILIQILTSVKSAVIIQIISVVIQYSVEQLVIQYSVEQLDNLAALQRSGKVDRRQDRRNNR